MAKKKAVPKTGVYLIHLEGGGDTFLKVVDKETFDWVTSDDLGQPEGTSKDEGIITVHMWEDQLIPASQIAKIKEEEGDDYDPIQITSGSYDNDRALAARPADGYDTYYTVREVMQAIKANNGELIDEYSGYIY